MINPDTIQAGDEVTLSNFGGERQTGTVVSRQGAKLLVDLAGDVLSISLAGKKSPHQIVGHRPWLPA